jgi:hypothetical protein
MAAIGMAHAAPWYFTATAGVSTLMAAAIFLRDRRSGLLLEGGRLTLFRGAWRRAIDVGTIRRVRITRWSEGQPSVWLDVDDAPPYRLPGECFGSAEALGRVFRQRGIPVE